jgi:hypothetical protein
MTTADDRDRKLPGRPAGLGTEPGPSSRYAARVVGYGYLQAALDAIPPGWHLVAAMLAGAGAQATGHVIGLSSTVVLLLERELPPLRVLGEATAEVAARWSFTCPGCGARELDARRRDEFTMCSTPGCHYAMRQEEILLDADGLAHAENVSLRAEVERWKAAQREAAEASMRHESQRDEARIALADMTKRQPWRELDEVRAELLKHGIKLGHVELPAAGVARLGAECDLLRRGRALGWR